MLVGKAKLRAGDIVLAPGAGSGVGSAAIQICKMLGVTVITTAGDEHKLEKARELGADYTIDHYKQKISEEVKRITNRRGVDIVFEHVGVATWPESIKSLKYGHAGDLRRDHRLRGSTRSAGALRSPVVTVWNLHGGQGELLEIMKHVFSGKLKPVVDRTFPLAEARAAHEYLEKSEQFGKVVLVPGQSELSGARG